jgi:glycosyltransferase involved in cell wall biosynthesis
MNDLTEISPDLRSVDVPHTLTIAIPVLNEQKHIQEVLRSLCRQTYGCIVEILVVDGGSIDGTIHLVHEVNREDPRVLLLHNPKAIVSAALNLALDRARGSIFLRADAHCIYSENYVEKCVETLNETGAKNVGGAQRFIAYNHFQLALALVVNTYLGSGGAKYRDPNHNGWVDTVFLGCFRTDVLRSIGGYSGQATNEDAELNIRLQKVFNESQTTNEDWELNFRLRKATRRAVYVSSAIIVHYVPRQNFEELIIQYWKYGRGRYLSSSAHALHFQRGQIPTYAVITGLVSFMLCIYFLGTAQAVVSIICVVLIIGLYAIISVVNQYRHVTNVAWHGAACRPPGKVRLMLICWCQFLIMPLSHTIGYMYQMIKTRFGRRLSW